MSFAELHRGSDRAGNYTVGWVVSVLLHGSLAAWALLFVQRIQLAPQLEPFKWNVALVSSDTQSISSAASSSLAPNPVSTPARPTIPSAMPPTQPAPPVLAPTQPEPPQPEPPVMTATALPTPLPQAELQPAGPAPRVMIPTSPAAVKPADPVPPAPPASAETPLAVEPQKHTPALVESVSPSRQTGDSETATIPPQRESDSTTPVTPVHPEPSTLISPTATALPEPATSITPHMTTPPETSVSAASSSPQVAALVPSGANRPARTDYGWLSEVVLRRVEELKRYPAEARVDRAEGKVVVKAVINEDGSVDNVEIFQSSGSPTLDNAAVDLMRRAAPFALPHSLGKPRVTIKIPMNYRLDR